MNNKHVIADEWMEIQDEALLKFPEWYGIQRDCYLLNTRSVDHRNYARQRRGSQQCNVHDFHYTTDTNATPLHPTCARLNMAR